MDSFSIEKPVRYYDQVYNTLREMIVQGDLKPGDSIYEARIARDLNISRSPVREAVRALEKEGLLAIDEKSRITVYKPTLKDIVDIYECRMVLESLAARLTTRLATAQELQNIEKTVIDSKQYLDVEGERNRQALIAENGRFHELIIKYSQNRRLKKQLRDLHSLSHYFRTLNFQGENREWIVYNEHQDILAQMKRRDEDKAAFMMNKHLETDLEHLKEIFTRYTKE
ncbi:MULTISPECIES: GntR family transcriptional regulator [Neobacillus]|uniref:GntR family transcriptional regulator n=1 Tax=Neobacillus rhizophilus TaxID=2833579 RepID=A0A942U146_9BACI|nr:MULTISPECIES: GntR family transcriptional regulator [Neobacillus]MBS4210968.1 GntR family transcriptional regulator [Neobacillus rhizophilus]MBU8917482.1 GntR family transcriptional regulator [Bacillus sp. FJAT-29953]